jgi:hypothetical protein
MGRTGLFLRSVLSSLTINRPLSLELKSGLNFIHPPFFALLSMELVTCRFQAIITQIQVR